MAGFDVSFGIGLDLGAIQEVVTNGAAIDEALRHGISLSMETWGAYASLIVDPINIDITLFGTTQSIIDSSIAVSAELRSADAFYGSIQDMIDDAVDTSVLVPTLSIPLSTDLSFNFSVMDNVYITPMMQLNSPNLVSAEFMFDFDVGLDTFLESSPGGSSFGSNTLDGLFENVTNLLGSITAYAPDLTAGSSSSAFSGLLDVVQDFQDLVGGLGNFTDLVEQGKTRSFVCCRLSFYKAANYILTHKPRI